MISLSAITKSMEKAMLVPEKILNTLRPQKPYDFLRAQPPSFADVLPYEVFLELERPTCLLSDGSLGVMWEMSPLEHEVMDDDDLTRRAEAVAEIFEKVRAPGVSFQVIFDAEPSSAFPLPECVSEPRTAPAQILKQRVDAVALLAKASRHRLTLMKRRVFLTARLEAQKSLGARMGSVSSEIEAEATLIATSAQKMKEVGDEVEYTLHHAGVRYRALAAEDFLSVLRATFHTKSERETLPALQGAVARPGERLAAQVLRDFLTLTPAAVGVGRDAWEAASWLEQPPTVHAGLMARLMEIEAPVRVVLNVRPCADLSDLETKKVFLKNASDSYGEMQREEVKATQDRIARGETLSFVSLHIFVRNRDLSASDAVQQGAMKGVLSRLKTTTQMDFVMERYAAPAIFLLSLPFGYSAAAAGFTGRERRVLSRNLAPYLPLFGGFRGTKTPLQLMVSRGGDAVWLNPFDSQTSPHVAVLASSGAGKSFFQQNMMMSLFATLGNSRGADGKSSPLLFIIDKKTSYEIFARVVGEEFGSQIVKPPEYFPNIFRGSLDEYRLPVIVGILKTAVSLVTKDASLGAIEEMVLSDAVRATFEQNALDARTEYTDGTLREKSVSLVKIPRLSDVVDNLFPVCAKSGTPVAVAEALAGYLSPFMGTGPYASLFDREAHEEFEAPTPGVSLFDIDAVSAHPVLSTLTTQMILAEILRQIRRSENRGRVGMLVIEEAGVLAEGSPELVRFIQDAWKTFRKLGFSCVGLTNEVDDYVRKAGPREIWNVSPNKIILKMTEKDLQKARSGSIESGLPPLIEDEHIGNLISSLKKEDGAYAQGLWWSDEAKGTFVYMPTGFDYWCAASKPIEVSTVHEAQERVGSYFKAVAWLAERFPRGVLGDDGRPRALSSEELPTEAGRKK